MEKWTRLLVIVSTLLVLVVFVGLLIQLGMKIEHTLLLFSLGALVAYALEPVVTGLRQRPGLPYWLTRKPKRAQPAGGGDHGDETMSRTFAISVVYLGLVVIGVLSAYGLAKPLASQIHALTDKSQQSVFMARADSFLNATDEKLKTLGIPLHLDDYFHNPADIPPNIQEAATSAEKDILPAVRDIAISIGESVIVLLISLYLLIYSSEMKQKLNEQMPPNLRIHAEVWEEDINRILGGFVRGQLIISLIIGALAAILLLALGIHLWLLLGIFVAIASLIPVFGPYLGAVPAIIAALIGPTHFSNNIVAAVILLAFFIVINEVASKILYPRLVGQAIGLHEVLVLFVIFAGLEVGGVIGVLFAAPLTAIAFVTIIHLYRFWLDLPDSLLSHKVDSPIGRKAHVAENSAAATELAAPSPPTPTTETAVL